MTILKITTAALLLALQYGNVTSFSVPSATTATRGNSLFALTGTSKEELQTETNCYL
jgi:hypothetical protein